MECLVMPGIDRFESFSDTATGPSRAPFAIIPSDSLELVVLPKALYVGTGGTVVLRGLDAAVDVTFRNVASGQILDVRARFVRATGTTAGDIVGLA
jgi:hypothetical protein